MFADGLFCFLCSFPLAAIRRDKRGRPFFSCHACGAMLFVRTEQALRRLCELIDAARQDAVQRLGQAVQDALARPSIPAIDQVKGLKASVSADASVGTPS